MMLSTAQKRIVSRASKQSVEIYFNAIRQYFPRSLWLATTNRYSQDIKQLKLDSDNRAILNQDLGEYLAASAITHCSDGWSYFGRAIDSLSRGDCNIARHLAYYAELRATMSLLAREGLGIFDDRHFILNTGNNPELICRLGTHGAIWPVLQAWADTAYSSSLIGDIIRPQGIPLENWITSFTGTSSFHPIGNKWLKDWGIDLSYLADDSRARNIVSYRPTSIANCSPVALYDCSNFIKDFWSLCEPSGTSFSMLDNHLLRISLEEAFKAQTGISAHIAHVQFKNKIDNIITSMLSTSDNSSFKQFLLRQTSPNVPTVLVEASKLTPVSDPHHHIQVLSRAALLLRLATGACGQLANTVGINSGELDFWVDDLGENLGLWDIGNRPAVFSDLWSDIENALNELKGWETGHPGQTSFYNWTKNNAKTLSTLGSSERILLWDLGA